MTPSSFAEVVQIFINIISAMVPAVGLLALFFFMWGGFQVLLNSGNEQALAEGKKRLVYGIIALFVMVSVWGILEVLDNTFFAIQGPPSSR
jgi:hypothetical protein